MKAIFKEPFLKFIKKTRDSELKKLIENSIIQVETSEDIRNISGLKKLKGHKEYYRIKLNEYRIGLKIIKDTVYFVDIAHRKDIYKRFP